METAVNLELKRRIMRRVYAVWFLRRVAPILVLELLLVVGVAVGVLSQISPRQIVLNALSASADIRAFIQFFVDNFFVKSVQSRLLAGLWTVFLVFLLRDLRRVVRLTGRGYREFEPVAAR